MEFQDVQAASYDLFDAPSGRLVMSAPNREELFRELKEVEEEDGHQWVERLLVVALDDGGNRLGSWIASEIREPA